MSDTTKIRQTLDSIANCLDSLKSNVDIISEYIKTDSIVNPNVISNTMEELLKLKNSQDTLKKDYTELFPGEKCSDLLNDIITEVDKYETQLEEKKLLRQAKYITIKFKSIRSKVEECQKYLDEYSEELSQLSEQDINLDEFIKAVEPYEEFYQIVKNDSRDDKIAYSMKNTIFSSNTKLLLSLLQENLYIDESLLTDINEFVKTDSDEPIQLSFDTVEAPKKDISSVEVQNTEQSSVIDSSDESIDRLIDIENNELKVLDACESTKSTNNAVSENGIEISQDAESLSDITQEDNKSDLIELNEFKSFGITIKERDLFSNVNVEDNDDGEKVTTKKFKKDILKFNKGCGLILLVLTQHLYLTEKFLDKGRASEVDFKPVFESLLKSGYIRKDTIGDYPEMYSLSNKALKCLKDKSNADWYKRIKIDYKNALDTKNVEVMPKECENNQNIILTRVGYCVIDKFIDDFYSQGSLRSSHCLSDYYCSDIREFGKHKTSFYFLSCFINNDETATSVINEIKFHISKLSVTSIDYSILISDNLEECNSLMNYLKSKYECFSNTKFYCYSVVDMKYFDIATKEEITKDDLLQTATAFHKSKYSSANKEKELKEANNKSTSTLKIENNISIYDNENRNEVTSSEFATETQSAVIDSANEECSIINEKAAAESIDSIADIIEEISTDNSDSFDVPAVDYSMVYDTQNISEEVVMANVYSMINAGKAYCASAYLGVVSPEAKYSNLKNELSFALNTPDKKGVYLSDVVMNIFDDFESVPGAFSDCLKVCAEMRVLFYNTAHHDYSYKQMYAVMKSLEPIEANPALSDLVYKLEEFKAANNMGIDVVADYRIKDNITRERIINDLSKDAKNLYDTYITNHIKENSSLPRYYDMKKMMFKETNSLSECLKIVSENSCDETFVEYVRDFINSNFIDENIEIKSDNIKKNSINEYIDYFWNEAGKTQRDKQRSSKLVSELRNNIFKSISKIVANICDWYYYAHNSLNTSSLKGYDKDKNIIKSSIVVAISCIDKRISENQNNPELLAGYNCIRATLNEFEARMDGSYNETVVKYYYVDFLKYGDVILDENFLPEFKGHNIRINNFMPTDCIIRHSKRPDRSFEERIEEIFSRVSSDEKMSDDYGCAQLIKNYFIDCQKEWDDEKNNITTNTDDALKEFKSNYESFKGSLELSQSYGQIDNDRKEQMLAMVNVQYIKNESAHNFGYFARLVSYVEETIKYEAKKREKTLRANLETVAKDSENSEKAKPFIDQAREMLERQNYTVAEDLIHRIQNHDFENNDDIFEEDNFIEFINEYSSNYKIVSDSSRNLKKIIQNSRRPMKDTKRGVSLIDNFPTGSHQSAEKIKNLLLTLGFPVDKVSVDTTTQKNYDSYSIELIKSSNGKKENYTHPVSPFGSLAEENGFRVICLFGMYDARRLIDKFKEIGTTRHTLVLLDYALNAPERRTLARKIKEEISDKVFIVVDRVTIFYLANHFTENTINRILMEITMPYSSYQPYSIDSARPIPVEMFMGRKDQLEDIESPTGANIICGGRQLGKSALLRMAKSDINRNENGDRAVYVEIKDCDCKKAANKISATLVDEGILPEGSETTEWNVLSRAIKKRLNSSTEDKIPYLLLLIDEADAFIDDCKNYKYAPLDDLEDIQSIGVNRFKFVVAGLRNLVKFEKEKSMANNSGIAHLSQKTIRPFTYTEACELLEKPLHYLGIRFPKDESYLVSLILANTNYFPGLIHFYCAKLIEAVKKYDPVFDENSSPPYEVTEAHIKRVLADPEFRMQIKDKFEITLKLDTDNYYHIIVILMAYCNYTAVSADGYSAEEIYKNAEDYDIMKIKKLDIEKLSALMDELCELNILRKNPNGKYLFARYNFLQLLGTSSEIDEMILNYSEAEG